MAEKTIKLEKTNKKVENLEKILNKIFSFLEAKCKVENGATIVVNITSQDSGRLIGRFGQTLETLQYLVRLIANHQLGERVSLVVDVEGYKASKNQELEELALSMADNVQKSGYPQTLRPMNAYERRVIHAVLNDFGGVETVSQGEEPNRYIEIRPKGE